jgi:natural product precursor
MKTLKVNKIKLNKQTVSNLELNELRGGATVWYECGISGNTICPKCPTFNQRACDSNITWCNCV